MGTAALKDSGGVGGRAGQQAGRCPEQDKPRPFQPQPRSPGPSVLPPQSMAAPALHWLQPRSKISASAWTPLPLTPTPNPSVTRASGILPRDPDFNPASDRPPAVPCLSPRSTGEPVTLPAPASSLLRPPQPAALCEAALLWTPGQLSRFPCVLPENQLLQGVLGTARSRTAAQPL